MSSRDNREPYAGLDLAALERFLSGTVPTMPPTASAPDSLVGRIERIMRGRGLFTDPTTLELFTGIVEEVLREQPGGGAASIPPDVAAMQARLKEYASTFDRLQTAACPIATVVRVKGEKTFLSYSGRSIEVVTPEKMELAPGSSVKIDGNTMQILEMVADDAPSGEVVTVARVPRPGLCEIERAGGARAVSFGGKVEEGDRVVLDATGCVVVANLWRAPNAAMMCEPTGVTWDDIGGLDEAKRLVREAVESATRHGDLFARYKKRPIRGLLLHGPPGCGKTMIGKAAATGLAELHGRAGQGAFFYVKGPELLNKFVGSTEESIRALFSSARRFKREHGFPPILFFDEAESILGARTGTGWGLEKTIVPQFLAEMDGIGESGALVILATNLPNSLDPAIVRDGRIDRRIKIGRPSEQDAAVILGKHLRGVPLQLEHEAAVVAARDAIFDRKRVMLHVRRGATAADSIALTFGHCVNGAMLAGVVDRATSFAIARETEGGAAGVSSEDILRAIDDVQESMMGVNLRTELAEFCAGWEHELGEVRAAPGPRQAAAGMN